MGEDIKKAKFELMGKLWRKKGYLSGYIEVEGVRLNILIAVNNRCKGNHSHYISGIRIGEFTDEL